jgi:hypothetical protein
VKDFRKISTDIENLLRTGEPWKNRLEQAQEAIDRALAQQVTLRTFATVLESYRRAPAAGYTVLLSNGRVFDAALDIGRTVSMPSIPDSGHFQSTIVSPAKLAYSYCISPNPVLRSLKLKAELNLHKIRTCRNIAGMKSALDPYAAATDQISGLPQIGANGQLMLPGAVTLQPTPYRFSFLIERAKQLVNIAQQMETAMLAALEKRDAEAYGQLKARQDVQLAGAQVKLQALRVQEAKDNVKLAELQQERAQIQVDYYQRLLDEGISEMEMASLALLTASAEMQSGAAIAYFVAASLPSSIGITGPQFSPQAAASNVASALSSIAGTLSTTASIFSTLASYERHAQEWEFQRTLAQHDVRIGAQQVTIAEDHVRVVGQERDIALMQKDHAKDTMEFLATKFTNVELYDWMSDVLEGVYGYFLQEATAVAKLAETQLAFERQSTPPHYIQDDYWEAPSEDMAAVTSPAGKSTDRRGLTGSARLLQDIYQLDQYAIETDKRKLQLSKTISLAAMSPVEFQRFRETGVMTFRTPLEIFDRDFPGHYLRLIKRVRASVIALIPPTQGIHAALSTTASSRVVIGGDVFQEVIVHRDPEMVALTSPRDASGLFDLQQQPEMLLPFESLGVDTTWEFRLPKAANRFDYDTLADVLLTIDYTALNSYDYYQQVIQTLKPKLSADRAFSFRHELSDQWYDLHHPEFVEAPREPMVVQWKTRREDFPPNLERLKIQHVVLYFVRASGEKLEVPVTHLHFTEQGSTTPVGGGAVSIDGVISTRKGNAGGWMTMIGKNVTGQWELSLQGDSPAKDKEIRGWFKNEKIENILFVITYSGDTAEWPT